MNVVFTVEGFLFIDKPAGLTSHDVVNRVRRLTGEKRVGHAGTLDPFATGLLIVGVGRMATREMQKLVGLDKVYEAEFVLGASSDTDDRTGVITPLPIVVAPGFPARQPVHRSFSEGGSFSDGGSLGSGGAPRLKPGATDWKTIEEALKPFLGKISQIPPTYSAIKINGKKMYEEARKGKPMEAKPRVVNIYKLDIGLIGPRGPMISVTVKIHCSSGTYIRSIARDLGRALGGGGYVEQLRRTAIGPFSVSDSQTLESLGDSLTTSLIPVSELLSRLLTNTSGNANLPIA